MFEYEKNRRPIQVDLLTRDDFDIVNKVPILGEEGSLKMQKKFSFMQFSEYLNNVLEESERNNERIVISGWMEFRISVYQSSYEQFAQDLLKSEKIGTIAYDNSARIVFLHKDQLREWKDRLNVHVKRTQMKSEPIIYFIIVAKPEKFTERTRFITPKIVTSDTGSTGKLSARRKDSLDSLESEEEKSEPSSIEDFEEDFGAEILDEGSSISSLHEGMEEEEEEEAYEETRAPFTRRPNRGSYGYNKRNYEEFEDEDFSKDLAPMKKVKFDILPEMEKEEIVEKLQEMEPEEITYFAANLDPRHRHIIMEYLMQLENEETDAKDSQEEEQEEDFGAEYNPTQTQEETNRPLGPRDYFESFMSNPLIKKSFKPSSLPRADTIRASGLASPPRKIFTGPNIRPGGFSTSLGLDKVQSIAPVQESINININTSGKNTPSKTVGSNQFRGRGYHTVGKDSTSVPFKKPGSMQKPQFRPIMQNKGSIGKKNFQQKNQNFKGKKVFNKKPQEPAMNVPENPDTQTEYSLIHGIKVVGGLMKIPKVLLDEFKTYMENQGTAEQVETTRNEEENPQEMQETGGAIESTLVIEEEIIQVETQEESIIEEGEVLEGRETQTLD